MNSVTVPLFSLSPYSPSFVPVDLGDTPPIFHPIRWR